MGPDRRYDPLREEPPRDVRRALPAVLAVLLAAGLAPAASARSPPDGATPRGSTSCSTTSPTPTTRASTRAIDGGQFRAAHLDVKPRTPSDPSAPLKLLASGRADLAISYEPELLLARDKGQQLVSIGALVQKPLTSIVSLGSNAIREPGELEGTRVGTAGIPYQDAYLKTIVERAGIDPDRVRTIDVGFNLVPALLTKSVDATLGAFWNVEGVELERRDNATRRSCAWTASACRPTTSSSSSRARRTCARAGALLRRFMRALALGHEPLRNDLDTGVGPLVNANPDLGAPPAGAGQGHAAGVLPVGRDQPFGFQEPRDVAALRALDDSRTSCSSAPRPPTARSPTSSCRARGLSARPEVTLREVSLRDVRRLALHAQGLAAAAPRGGRGRRRSPRSYERIGCLQLDPVSAVARSPLLVLSRGWVRCATRRWRRRPMRGGPCSTPGRTRHRWSLPPTCRCTAGRCARTSTRPARARCAGGRSWTPTRVLRGPRGRAARARPAARPRPGRPLRGALAPRPLDRRGLRAPDDRAHAPPAVGLRPRRHRGREAGERLWDVFERCLPPGAPTPRRTSTTSGRARGGAARGAHARRRPAGARRAALPAPALPRLPTALAALVATGRWRRCGRGLGGAWYAAPEDLDRIGELAPGARTTVLSPFDNLLCDRARTAELFGFDHRLEIYVPRRPAPLGLLRAPDPAPRAPRRARRPALDARAGLLRVHSLHREHGVRRTPALDRAVARALERLAAWRGARGVEVAREA